MQMCSSFSDVLFSNWRCRETDEDHMNSFALSILLLELFLPGFPCDLVVGAGGVSWLTVA